MLQASYNKIEEELEALGKNVPNGVLEFTKAAETRKNVQEKKENRKPRHDGFSECKEPERGCLKKELCRI